MFGLMLDLAGNVESVESQYINISPYRPLSGCSYIDLPVELRSPRIGLIDIKNKDQKCFKLDYNEIQVPVQKKDFNKIEVKNNICINVFGYKNEMVFPIYISDQKFEESMDLLILSDNDKSHYLYIKDLDRSMFHKTKNKNKKWFCRSFL